jgi:hypothetical protein
VHNFVACAAVPQKNASCAAGVVGCGFKVLLVHSLKGGVQGLGAVQAPLRLLLLELEGYLGRHFVC